MRRLAMLVGIFLLFASCTHNRSGTRTYSSPDGWAVSYPAAWHLQVVNDDGFEWHKHGVLLSNLSINLHHPQIPNGETSAWDMANLPSYFVLVEVGQDWGLDARCGFDSTFPCRPDTPLPLSLGEAKASSAASGDTFELPFVYIGPIWHNKSDHYLLRAWFGKRANSASRRAAEAIVASFHF
jgi:hypothetical protein